MFDALLPEYQRYLGLIMLGHTPLGMFSFAVDKMWHSLVLCSHLWADCCLRLHGSPINHVAQVPLPGEDEVQMCTTCRSCRNCSGGGQGCDNAVPGALRKSLLLPMSRRLAYSLRLLSGISPSRMATRLSSGFCVQRERFVFV